MSLTTAQRANYERDGFLIYGSVLLPEEVEALSAQIDALASGEHPAADKIGIRLEDAVQRGELADVQARDRVWQLTDVHRHDGVILEHASNPRILDIVEELLGTEDIKLFGDQTLMKPAFHGSPVSWHQDSAYWTSIEPMALVSCWTALDDATTENGCVQMIPGSHKQGVWSHDRSEFLHAQGADELQSVPVVLKAGGCSFHHSLTVHGSGENRTPHRRRGVVTSYMRADSRWIGDPLEKPDFHHLRGREYSGCV